MSTILKALKRLEQEKDSLRPAGPTPVFSRSPSALGGPAGWFLTPWVRRGTLGFIIIALSVAAFHFYSQSRSHSPKKTGQTAVMGKNTPSAKAAQNNPRPSTIAPVAKEETVPARPENPRPPQKGAADFPQLVAQANPGVFPPNWKISEPCPVTVSVIYRLRSLSSKL